MTANDVLIMWAQFDNTACVSGSGQYVTGALAYKQSNLAATTTLSTVEDSHSAAGGRQCNAVAIGSMTATTTVTTTVNAVVTSTSFVSLVVQHLIR